MQDLDVDDRLMEEWFDMVQEKTRLVRQESEVVYELRDLELIEQHDQLDAELRIRLANSQWSRIVHIGSFIFLLSVLYYRWKEKRNGDCGRGCYGH